MHYKRRARRYNRTRLYIYINTNGFANSIYNFWYTRYCYISQVTYESILYPFLLRLFPLAVIAKPSNDFYAHRAPRAVARPLIEFDVVKPIASSEKRLHLSDFQEQVYEK